MAIERTLSIIKPDAVAKNAIGQIEARFEAAGLTIVALKMMQLSEEKAGGFYAEHRERGFFGDLVAFMTSGPVVVQVLEGENAVAKNRELMGATNPKDAAPGTIRADLAENIEASPWANRITAYHEAIQNYALRPELVYDTIVSNPPFFENHLPSKNAKRQQALHQDTLSMETLVDIAQGLLQRTGHFWVLYPTHESLLFNRLAI